MVRNRRTTLALASAVAVVSTSCLVKYDFDGDDKADYVYVDEHGDWYYAGDTAPFFAPADRSGADPVPGDYDGDGQFEAASATPAGFETDGAAGIIEGFPFAEFSPEWCEGGQLQWVPADYDDDPETEPAVFSSCDATWYIHGHDPVQFGAGIDVAPPDLEDVPVPADYDGDGTDDLAVYRPTDGTFHVQGLGQVADLPRGIPVPADYDGDGTDDPAVWRMTDGSWHIDGQAPLAPFAGQEGDWPVPADYDGDGSAERALFDPSTGTWHVEGLPSVTDANAAGDYSWPVPGAAPHAMLLSFIRLAYAEYCEANPC